VVRWLGRITYERGLELQEEVVARKMGAAADELLLLEHDPVYTIGRTPDRTSLRELENLPHPVVTVSRGGKATYHGPGQLVGYPILDLRTRGQDLHHYLRLLEEFLITLLSEMGVQARRREGLTGAWVGERKIASIGVGVRRWISMHGFALNVCGELRGFEAITPCGLDGVKITSVERELGRDVSVEEVAQRAGECFARHPQLGVADSR
jgi:lipoyl(octanoyl) transferase